MNRKYCIFTVFLFAAASAAAMAADSSFLRIDHAGPISWERIKVFNDQVYFYQITLGKLTSFDPQGNVLSVHRFDAQDFQGLLPAKDFAVGSEGQIFLTGRTRSGGDYILTLSESQEAQQVELSSQLDVRKIAVPPDGAPVILGWDEAAFESVKALAIPGQASPRAASVPRKPIPILHRCDPASQTSREMAYLPLTSKPQLAGKIAWSLYVTPFAADWRGNVYFSTADGQVHTQAPKGGLKSRPLPLSSEEVQVVHNILPHPGSNVLVAVHEGANAAPEEDKACGMIAMLSPNMRVFAYDGRSFEEIYSGREVKNLVGVFSDGGWVTALKKRTSIELARFKP